MSAMLEISNVEVRYGRLVALRGLSMEVRQGEVVCLIGPNGAGKSTTMAAIAVSSASGRSGEGFAIQ